MTEEKKNKLHDLVINESYMLSVAEKINVVLHSASINKDDRGIVIASLLLAQIDSKLEVNVEPDVFIKEINSRVKNVLVRHDKKEFYKYIQIHLPDKHEAQKKFQKALVKAMYLMEEINIQAIMNSGTDVLGRFYEAFLRYGNGPKDIGIVLTPRHITRFANEVLDISKDDLVYDPTCGTGSFLVSALDKVCQNCSEEEFDNFKKNKIFGIEQQAKIAALAVINMIFRGAGKNHIINNDCLSQHLTRIMLKESSAAQFLSGTKTNEKRIKNKDRPVTKVLMNPPFSLRNNNEKEFRFIEHALDQMQDGGLLFSVVPYSILLKQGQDKQFRKCLLENNTLLSVITFPQDLFYPVGIHTAGIIIQKGYPHPKDQNVLWIRALADGYMKVKGKRLSCKKSGDDIEKITLLVKRFIKNPGIKADEIERFQTACPIDMSDKTLELVPEVYLNEKSSILLSEIIEGLEKTIREFLAYLIWSRLLPIERINKVSISKVPNTISLHNNFKEVSLGDILGKPDKGSYHVHSVLGEGDIPLISTTIQNNGVVGYFDVPDELTFKDAITVTSDGTPLTAFYHPYVFTAKDNVIVFTPGIDKKLSTIFYIVTEINRVKWRFSYGRKCYLNKINKVKIMMPVKKDGAIDQDYIEDLVNTLPGWHLIQQALKWLQYSYQSGGH